MLPVGVVTDEQPVVKFYCEELQQSAFKRETCVRHDKLYRD